MVGVLLAGLALSACDSDALQEAKSLVRESWPPVAEILFEGAEGDSYSQVGVIAPSVAIAPVGESAEPLDLSRRYTPEVEEVMGREYVEAWEVVRTGYDDPCTLELFQVPAGSWGFWTSDSDLLSGLNSGELVMIELSAFCGP
jgi:hypothetical protein